MILEKNQKQKNLIVALSGGVDSAVAALFAKNSGAQVRAVFMKNWRDDDEAAGCHDKNDLIAAAACAEALGLDFEVVEFVEEYRQQVFLPFLAELCRGRTPNPDILCNSCIKFSAFADYAKDAGADAVVTGHYARIDKLDDNWRLCRGEDAAKDQSYFLHRLTQAQLSYGVFPLAHLHKSEVREIARKAGLNNWSRKDSTGICFVGERQFTTFLSGYLPETPGDIVDVDGRHLGQHTGLYFYTIGQRKGLEIGGAGGPWFVLLKDIKNNKLVVVSGKNNPLLFRQTLRIEDAHWIAGTPPPAQWVYAARLRHRHVPASCTLTEVSADAAQIVFAEPQRAPTPGQYAVIYDGNACLGGGVITD